VSTAQPSTLAVTGSLPIAVLFSGRGSNLAYLLHCMNAGRLPAHINTLICNRADAAGLQQVMQQALAVDIIDDRQIGAWHSDASGNSNRAAAASAFERRLGDAIAAGGAQWIVLAGFMRILSASFIARFAGRIINLHPSLLPAYPGLHTHARALADSASEYGASIHFVDTGVDTGPVLAQHRMAIEPDSTPSSMAADLLPHEHRLLAACIALFCRHTVTCDNRHIVIDGQPLQQPLLLDRDLHWP